MVAGNWQQSDITGSLDCLGNITLVFGAVAGNPSWYYLAALGYEIAESTGILVVNAYLLVCAETAYFTTLERSLFSRPAGALL